MLEDLLLGVSVCLFVGVFVYMGVYVFSTLRTGR